MNGYFIAGDVGVSFQVTSLSNLPDKLRVSFVCLR